MVSTPNIRASSYIVAQTKTPCWKCRDLTNVYSIMLGPGHEVFQALGDFDPNDSRLTAEDIAEARIPRWQVIDCHTVYYDLTYIGLNVFAYLRSVSENRYRIDRVNGAPRDSLMNHCEHCGVRQSERRLHRSSSHGRVDNYAFSFVNHNGSAYPISTTIINERFDAIGESWVRYFGSCISEGSLENA